ncbi:PGAP1-like protein [Orenia metallireducens]|uniref:PGAP1-like protein n=1 Tax=Orenia metallireducens TaxID=1413210 RepID=A0A285F438_9FIRM|nr:alpha/beta fold hydrolase [Orenia metallireducens]SNY05813.1 PGAP1-like protein [Orenia metallireducens]
MFKRVFLIFIALLMLFSNNLLAQGDYDYSSKKFWQELYSKNKVVDYPLIFIHGIGANIDYWKQSMEAINPDYYEMRFIAEDKIYHNYDGKKKDYTIWGISYYTLNPMEEAFRGNLDLYALRVEKMVNLIKDLTGKDKVIIVAHSMGGLVSRRYMTLSQNNWDSVHKILTVGTPNEGVKTSVELVGQLVDLKEGSLFLNKLNKDWQKLSLDNSAKLWGVVGGIDKSMPFNLETDPDATDSAGAGFVSIASSIPYGEWKSAVGDNFNISYFDTPNFGFRLAVDATHMELLFHQGTFRGIAWTLTNFTAIERSREEF